MKYLCNSVSCTGNNDAVEVEDEMTENAETQRGVQYDEDAYPLHCFSIGTP